MREYPLSPELLAVSHAWKARDRRRLVVAAKGAPEAIADLCHLAPAECAGSSSGVEALARDGLRVLAVAEARIQRRRAPADPHDFDVRASSGWSASRTGAPGGAAPPSRSAAPPGSGSS